MHTNTNCMKRLTFMMTGCPQNSADDQRLYSLRESHTLLTAAIRSQTMPFFLRVEAKQAGRESVLSDANESKQANNACTIIIMEAVFSPIPCGTALSSHVTSGTTSRLKFRQGKPTPASNWFTVALARL